MAGVYHPLRGQGHQRHLPEGGRGHSVPPGPYGKGWPVEQFRDKHLVVITGGTGLAPVRSMLNMLAQTPGYARSVHLICGFKNADGIVFHSELEEWKNHFSTIYTLDNGTLEG